MRELGRRWRWPKIWYSLSSIIALSGCVSRYPESEPYTTLPSSWDWPENFLPSPPSYEPSSQLTPFISSSSLQRVFGFPDYSCERKDVSLVSSIAEFNALRQSPADPELTPIEDLHARTQQWLKHREREDQTLLSELIQISYQRLPHDQADIPERSQSIQRWLHKHFPARSNLYIPEIHSALDSIKADLRRRAPHRCAESGYAFEINLDQLGSDPYLQFYQEASQKDLGSVADSEWAQLKAELIGGISGHDDLQMRVAAVLDRCGNTASPSSLNGERLFELRSRIRRLVQLARTWEITGDLESPGMSRQGLAEHLAEGAQRYPYHGTGSETLGVVCADGLHDLVAEVELLFCGAMMQTHPGSLGEWISRVLANHRIQFVERHALAFAVRGLAHHLTPNEGIFYARLFIRGIYTASLSLPTTPNQYVTFALIDVREFSDIQPLSFLRRFVLGGEHAEIQALQNQNFAPYSPSLFIQLLNEQLRAEHGSPLNRYLSDSTHRAPAWLSGMRRHYRAFVEEATPSPYFISPENHAQDPGYYGVTERFWLEALEYYHYIQRVM